MAAASSSPVLLLKPNKQRGRYDQHKCQTKNANEGQSICSLCSNRKATPSELAHLSCRRRLSQVRQMTDQWRRPAEDESKWTPTTTPSSTLFSDVIDKKVSILVDPIRVIIERSTHSDHGEQLQQNRTFAAAAKIQWPPSTSNSSAALCALSLHRNANCDGPTIGPNERIGWDTRICFRWSCDGAAGTGMAMRVENCWTGSEHSPIELIDHLGSQHRSIDMVNGWPSLRVGLLSACSTPTTSVFRAPFVCATRVTTNAAQKLRRIAAHCCATGKEDEKERWRTELEQICTEERNRIQSAAAGSAVSRSTGRRWLINKMVVMLPSMIINLALSNKLTGRASIGG
ncbi:hypothetical protein GPALN_006315 [Globodera pallida]|nr:hypothetical protein GPALN_006315 [Globodera pallida]